MRILTIFTGGTIGSKAGNGKIQLDENKFKLIEYSKEKYGLEDVEFITQEPYFTLSENMNLGHWSTLTQCMEQIDKSQFDGIIITHGTDTLAYTANYLAMLFGNYEIPIVLVSSNYELSDIRANGIYNFKAAVDFIKAQIPGVYVTFYQEHKNIVHLGSRVMQSRHFFDDFISVKNIPFGYIEHGQFTKNECATNPSIMQIKNKQSLIKLVPNLKISKKVKVIVPHIGFEYENYNLEEIGAIVHTTYHSGTFCMEDQGFLKLLDQCKQREIPIFLAPICKGHTNTPYASTFEAIEKGVAPLPNLSQEAAYCKVLLLAQLYKGKQLEAKCLEDLFFEAFS